MNKTITSTNHQLEVASLEFTIVLLLFTAIIVSIIVILLDKKTRTQYAINEIK